MSRGDCFSLLRPAVAEPILQSVLQSLPSVQTQKAYRTAILDFLGWVRRFAKWSLGSSLGAWRAALVRRGLAPSSVNQRLSAVRLFFQHAKEHGAIRVDDAIELLAVRNVKLPRHFGGQGLTADQAGQLLDVPDPQTILGKRDRAMLTLLVVCGIQRNELVHLSLKHLQQRKGRWVLLIGTDREGKRRTVPVPAWVKERLDGWLEAAGIKHGILFRRLRKSGRLDAVATPLSDDSVYTLVKQAGAAIGKPGLTPRDLRRTCAQLCRDAGGSVEQIQSLFGQQSTRLTERSLTMQKAGSVNDRVKLRAERKVGTKK